MFSSHRSLTTKKNISAENENISHLNRGHTKNILAKRCVSRLKRRHFSTENENISIKVGTTAPLATCCGCPWCYTKQTYLYSIITPNRSSGYIMYCIWKPYSFLADELDALDVGKIVTSWVSKCANIWMFASSASFEIVNGVIKWYRQTDSGSNCSKDKTGAHFNTLRDRNAVWNRHPFDSVFMRRLKLFNSILSVKSFQNFVIALIIVIIAIIVVVIMMADDKMAFAQRMRTRHGNCVEKVTRRSTEPARR